MRYKTVLWDLDGTLLNTLTDLANSVNHALAACGLPAVDAQQVSAGTGNGVRELLMACTPDGENCPRFKEVCDAFVAHYGVHSKDQTRPYDGIMDVLDTLLGEGVKLAIVSNKVDFAVKALSRDYFGERMLSAVGDDPSRAKKPAPDSVWEAMRQMGVTAQETVYIGDSDVDVITARNAGIPCIAVTWGFRSEESLLAAGAQYVARKPEEILQIVKQL